MWLETVVLIEAAAAFWLSALNVVLLAKLASAANTRARRAGAASLTGVCGAHGLEALLFLWLGDTSPPHAWSAAALVCVRTALLASTGLISLLLVRVSTLRR